jgi:hypothetical protein
VTGKGWGPSRGRRVAVGLACLMIIVGIVGALGVPGLAAASGAPETPIAEDCSPHLSPYEICGTLNPGSSSKVNYYFAYNAGPSCAGGAQIPGGEVEGQDVQVDGEATGLQPDTTYSYCLVAVSEGTEAFSSALTFHTEPRSPEPPEAPVTEACSGASIPGHLCGTLNPGSATMVGYYFAYNVGASCAGGSETAHQPEVSGSGIPVEAQLSGLIPGVTYSYCLVAENPDGKASGNNLSFVTPPVDGDPGDGTHTVVPPSTGTANPVAIPIPASGCGALSGAKEEACGRLLLSLQKTAHQERLCKARQSIERKRCLSEGRRKTHDLRNRYRRLMSGTT